MIHRTNTYTSLAFATALALFLSGCGQKDDGDATASAGTDPFDSIRLLEAEPSGAIPVKAAREQLEPGDQAVVFGQIGGAKKPFLQGYAGFVLADTEIIFCNESDDDQCPTPWDACCEDPEKLKSSRASVQFVDDGGNSLEGSLQDFAGLEPLRKIAVTGTVAASSTPENLIIHAQGLFIE